MLMEIWVIIFISWKIVWTIEIGARDTLNNYSLTNIYWVSQDSSENPHTQAKDAVQCHLHISLLYVYVCAYTYCGDWFPCELLHSYSNPFVISISRDASKINLYSHGCIITMNVGNSEVSNPYSSWYL